MAYGELKVDSITFTDGGTDATVSVSGLVKNPTFSGDIVVNGNISGTTITGDSAGFGSVTGVTVTGTTANFVSGVFTTQISGTAITGDTAGFTTVTGTTVTGTTANFVTVSGTTVTGNAGNFTTATVTSGVFASGTESAPSVSVGTTSNGLYSPDTNQVALATSGTERVEFGTSEVVFNDGGEDYDFRIEGDTEANLFFVDASADAVGVGTSSPSADLYVKQSGTEITAATQTVAVFQRSLTDGHSAKVAIIAGNNATSDINFGDTDDEDAGILQYRHSSDTFNFNKSLGIGTTEPNSILTTNDSFITVQKTGTNVGFIGTADKVISGGSTSDFGISTNGGELLFGAGGVSEGMRLDSSRRLLVGTSSQSGGSLLQVNDNRIRIASSKTPASASDTGTAGEICWDSSYIYVCTATDTWKRAALSTW